MEVAVPNYLDTDMSINFCDISRAGKSPLFPLETRGPSQSAARH
jgi:hypothetical protein